MFQIPTIAILKSNQWRKYIQISLSGENNSNIYIYYKYVTDKTKLLENTLILSIEGNHLNH